MRSLRWIGFAAAIAALAGCGDRRLVLNIDVLSYLDPHVTDMSFGPVPAIPGGIETGEQAVIKDASVNMVAGTNNVASVETVSLSMKLVAIDSTGTGQDTLRVYMSDTETDPVNTPAVMVIPVNLNPGLADTVSVNADGDSRIADLFGGKQIRVTITTSLHGPETGPDLYGRVKMLSLDATLIASRKQNL